METENKPEIIDMAYIIKLITVALVEAYPNLIYVEKVRAFYDWSPELETWYVVNNKMFNGRVNEFANDLYKQAIANGNIELVRYAIKSFESSTKNTIQSIVRESTVEPIALLKKTPADRESTGYKGGHTDVFNRRKGRKTNKEHEAEILIKEGQEGLDIQYNENNNENE